MGLSVEYDLKARESLPELSRQIVALLQDIDYGSLEIIIHDSRIVQIEKHQKFRIQPLRGKN